MVGLIFVINVKGAQVPGNKISNANLKYQAGTMRGSINIS